MNAADHVARAIAILTERASSANALCGDGTITPADVDGVELALQACRRIARGSSIADEWASVNATLAAARKLGNMRDVHAISMQRAALQSVGMFPLDQREPICTVKI